MDNENLAQLEQTRSLERKKMSELGEAKKRMSALTNKRSVMISARFSGPMQDERLREVTKRLAQTESESLRMQSLLAKEAKKHPPGGGQVCVWQSSPILSPVRSFSLYVYMLFFSLSVYVLSLFLISTYTGVNILYTRHTINITWKN